MKVCEACKIIELNKNKEHIKNKQDVIRGEIYYADLNGATQMGRNVQAGERPVLIVSNDTGNRYSPNINIVPITSQNKKMVTHVDLDLQCLNKKSKALCENLMTIGKEKLKEKIGQCPEYIMKKIEKTINRQLKTEEFTEEEIKNEIAYYKETLDVYNQIKNSFFKKSLEKSINVLKDMAFYNYMTLEQLMIKYGGLTNVETVEFQVQ